MCENGDKRKPARPYVQEGGIFGRKKERDELEDGLLEMAQDDDDDENDEERGMKPRRGNLWNYLSGKLFSLSQISNIYST